MADFLTTFMRQMEQAEKQLPPKRSDKPVEVPCLSQFVKEGWHVIEGSRPLKWNWHMDAICDHIEAMLIGWILYQREGIPVEVQNLLVNVPPGSAKSRLVSVYAPAWMWLHWPSWKVICISANPRVALRDATLCRDVVQSDWYQSFNPQFQLRQDQNAKGSYWNTTGGSRSSFGSTAKVIGDRADCLLVDDPHDVYDVRSVVKKEEVINRWDGGTANRVNDPEASSRIGIMQRVDHGDWGGHVLRTQGWNHLCIPQEYTGSELETWIGWRDPRTEIGELMFPVRFPKTVLEQEYIRLGSAGYAAQHQQEPSPREGGLFKTHWWRIRSVCPPVLRLIWAWDLGVKKGSHNDYTVGCLLALIEEGYQILEIIRIKAEYPEQKRLVVDSYERIPTEAVLIEDAASGSPLLQDLQTTRIPVLGIPTRGIPKEERAKPTTATVESGKVWVLQAEWTDDFLAEMNQFPFGRHDDQVDAFVMALSYFAFPNRISESYSLSLFGIHDAVVPSQSQT